MDPVLPPGPEWLRRRQLIEERKVADLERRLRAPSVRSLADLDDTAIDYLSEPPEDGDTLVFDEALGNDLSPAGRWRPGAGGGGGGGAWGSVQVHLQTDSAGDLMWSSFAWQHGEGAPVMTLPIPGPPGGDIVVCTPSDTGLWHVSARLLFSNDPNARLDVLPGSTSGQMTLNGPHPVAMQMLLPGPAPIGYVWPMLMLDGDWTSARLVVDMHWVGPCPFDYQPIS